MHLRTPLVTLVALALMATGCWRSSDPSAPADGTSAPTSGSTTQAVPTPSPTPTTQGVRKVSLDDLAWTDVLRGVPVQLASGKAVDGEFSYEVVNEPVWSDADGDGHEDALAFLQRTQGTEVYTFGYVWLYDPETKKVTQVEDPVGDWNACGDELVSAKPGSPMGFELEENLRDHYDYQACGTTPLHPRTRTIAVSTGRLVMTKPYVAYGGICYPTSDQASQLQRSTPIRVFPGAKEQVVANAEMVYTGLPGYSNRTWPSGWIQVTWVTDEMKANNHYWGICGFIWDR